MPAPPPPPPGFGAPRSRWTNRRVAGLVLAGIIGLALAYPKASADTPKTWDPRIADLVSFVEHTRGLQFKHPVKVTFMPDDEFVAWARKTLGGGRGDSAHTDIDRGLGLIDASYGGETESADISGTVLGVYLDKTDGIRVRGTDLKPNTRVTVVHELVHALQDQHINLDRMHGAVRSGPEANGLRALIEGDATWVEYQYFDALSAKEQQAAEAGDASLAGSSLGRLPAIIRYHQGMPYSAGLNFVSIIHAQGGTAAIDAAYRRPPSELDIIDPLGYKSHPARSDSAEVWRLYAVLSTAHPPATALELVKGATSAHFGSQPDPAPKGCSIMTVEPAAAFTEPVDVLHPLVDGVTGAKLTVTGTVAELKRCVTDGQTAPNDRIETAGRFLDIRNATIGYELDGRVAVDKAVCVADLTASNYQPDGDPFQDVRTAAEKTCKI